MTLVTFFLSGYNTKFRKLPGASDHVLLYEAYQILVLVFYMFYFYINAEQYSYENYMYVDSTIIHF